MANKANWYPRPAPYLPGEDPIAYMFRLASQDDNPYDHVRSYYCALAAHDTCTEKYGGECECPHHWDDLMKDEPEES